MAAPPPPGEAAAWGGESVSDDGELREHDWAPPRRRETVTVSPPACGGLGRHDEYCRLFRIVLWAYVSAIPLTALFVAVGLVAGSFAMLAVASQLVVFVVVATFALYALRRVIRDNTFALPYGAGKLENFSSFLFSFSYLPFAAYFLYAGGRDLLNPAPVQYAITIPPLAISLIRAGLLYWWAQRLSRESVNPSPVLDMYVADFRLTVYNDAGVLVALGLGWLLVGAGFVDFGNSVDSLVAIAIAVRMASLGILQLRHDLTALLDLPLSEQKQLAIMRVLARHFADYDGVGALYTRISGKRHFVELELGFADEQTVGHVTRLARSMEQSLAEELPDLDFRIVAVLADEVH